MAVKKKLTVKQQRFVDFYDGNATDAARKAGYKGNANTIAQTGKENLRKPTITQALAIRENKRNGKHIMTREERQQFWSKMAKTAEKDSDKLKASELLGRSEADFTEKIKDVSERPKETPTYLVGIMGLLTDGTGPVET